MDEQALRDLKVMVVEDNRHMQMILKSVFSGIVVKEVRYFPDAESAYKEAVWYRPDIIITDYMLGELNGLQFVQKLRTEEDSFNREVPVILMTAHTERDVVLKARDYGVSDILAKPISARTLIEKIASVLENPRPFVETPSYSGPDRRRVQTQDFRGPNRRKS